MHTEINRESRVSSISFIIKQVLRRISILYAMTHFSKKAFDGGVRYIIKMYHFGLHRLNM